MMSGGTPARGFGALRSGPGLVGLKFTHTVTSGVVAMLAGQTGFSLGTFTSGKATLTFPRNFNFLAGFGSVSSDNDSATSRHKIEVGGVDVAAGTAVVRFTDQNNGATEDPGTVTGFLTLFVGE